MKAQRLTLSLFLLSAALIVFRVPSIAAAFSNNLAAINITRQGNICSAEDYLNTSQRLDSTYAPALHLLGVIQLDRGRIPEAISSLERSVQHQPDNLWTSFDLATALYADGQYNQAIAAWYQAHANAFFYYHVIDKIRLDTENNSCKADSSGKISFQLRDWFVDGLVYERGIVINGSFELDVNGDGLPDGWQPRHSVIPGIYTLDTGNDGRLSARINLINSGNPDTVEYLSQDLKLTSDIPYQLEGWVKYSAVASSRAALVIWGFNQSGVLEQEFNGSPKQAVTWEKVIVPFKFNKDISKVTILAACGGISECWFDDIKLLMAPN